MKQSLTRTALMLLLCLFAATTAWAQQTEHENDYLVLEWSNSQLVKTWTSIPTGNTVVSISAIAADQVNSMGVSGNDTYIIADVDAVIDIEKWVYGTVNLILMNGVTVEFTKGIRVKKENENAVLNIYAQSEDENVMGKLIVTNSNQSYAGIGGGPDYTVNEINIHGGVISATGGDHGAGIGGGEDKNGGTITILGGKVTAQGGSKAAGIGGGYAGSGENTIIYGGNVTANGGENAAGIGGGEKYNGGGKVGTVSIWGGTVNATGGYDGAGIGSGVDCVDNSGSVNIHGGTVTATGGTEPDDTKYGYAAGIGGGKNGKGCTVLIDGGTVNATGRGMFSNIDNNYGGAAIGGGTGQPGGNVSINGGTVTLRNGTTYNNSPMIGGGYPSEDHGSLSIGQSMWVRYANNTSDNHIASATDRIISCRLSDVNYLIIEPCGHSGTTYTIKDADYHTIGNCSYCLMGGTDEAHAFGDYSECSVCHLVSLADDADNSSILEHWNSEAKSVVLKGRKLWKDGKWNTLCLPFAINDFTDTPLEGATVKTLTEATFDKTNSTLTLNFTADANNLTAIEAGKPYIVKWATTGENTTNPVFNAVTISSTTPTDVEGTAATFHGVFSPYSTGGEDKKMLYLGAGNKLYYPSEGMTIGAFRAYFQLNGDITAGAPNGVRTFVLNFGDETGDATRLNDKVKMINDKEAGAWYDMQGRRMAHSQFSILHSQLKKGVYINNGKKVVIK